MSKIKEEYKDILGKNIEKFDIVYNGDDCGEHVVVGFKDGYVVTDKDFLYPGSCMRVTDAYKNLHPVAYANLIDKAMEI